MSKFHGAKSGYEAGKQFLKKVFGKKSKVSPTIKSVKPNLKKTVDQSKLDEYRRRYTSLDKSDTKIKTGKEMMREGQKERKKLVDTGRAFQFRFGTSYHAVDPRESKKYADNIKKPKPQKKFKKGKELDREKKMGGGMMGRRFGYSEGSSKGKVPTTPKEKSLAKLAPPKDRITFGDVVAGRTKGKRMQAKFGGGADTGKLGELRSKLGVVQNKIKRKTERLKKLKSARDSLKGKRGADI